MKDPPSEGGPAAINPGLWFNRLLYYVIATCYRKMEHRLGNKTLSKPYIDSLNLVKPEDVSFNESLPHEQPSRRENEADWSFLEFVQITAHRLRTQIPHIREQAELAAANKDFQLYNKNTCKEFHLLLLELLQRFQTSLKDLKANVDNDQFPNYVRQVLSAGYGLQTMSKGTALRMHLRTIEAKLVDPRRPDMSMPMPRGNAEKDEEQGKAQGEEQDEEQDEELEAVQTSAVSMEHNVPVPVPLWKSYRNWLKLMVIYFDAVSTLFQYITGPTFNNQRISLKILVAPPTDKALLPWRELFNDPKLFPTETEADPFSTNADILNFLNDAALSNKECVRFLKALKEFSGTLHCEACLASLLQPAHLSNNVTIDSHWQGILDQMKVHYVVSRRFYQ